MARSIHSTAISIRPSIGVNRKQVSLFSVLWVISHTPIPYPLAGGNLKDHIEISRTYNQRVRLLRTEGSCFQARFINVDANQDILALVHTAIDLVLEQLHDPSATDMIGMDISHPNLDYPIIVPFQRHQQLNSNVITRLFDEVRWGLFAVS